ncbi:unnamed protein product [Peronospora farinosa]|uniref:V-type proton ATPase subunit E n=1 Tax=Peronospora farinosa TaxID=134698 RepID=A0ABN8BW59_9STRA|nr:unnamed protein product [Peronospora farinosa]
MNEFDVDRLIKQMVNFIYLKTQEKANAIRMKIWVLLRDLIVQSLVKLFETDVVVAVRAKDVEVAEMVVTEATDKYIATMKKEAYLDVNEVKVTVNKIGDGMLSNAKAGGVVLYAKQGKIVCDNTLDTRLDQIYYDLKPTVHNMCNSGF